VRVLAERALERRRDVEHRGLFEVARDQLRADGEPADASRPGRLERRARRRGSPSTGEDVAQYISVRDR
jgi:hypothetical protein